MDIPKKYLPLFLEKETFCVVCNEHYSTSVDPFVTFIDHNNKNITYNLCDTCIQTLYMCNKSDCDPWDPIFLSSTFKSIEITAYENGFHI